MPEETSLPIDKSAWGPGPWQEEPDRVEFTHATLPCLILRSPRFGSLCGYVAVPPGHPLHGRGYDDRAVAVKVHGGLSYAGACQGRIRRWACCVPAPGEPEDVWWFGFDCGMHTWDLAPVVAAEMRLLDLGHGFRGEVYRDLAYVRSQVESLAEQLEEADAHQ